MSEKLESETPVAAATACSALRICSAHAECPVKECVHKVPHACEHVGMHRVSECYTAKIHSACLTIVDGKIPKSRWKKCDCCNSSEWITEMIPISSQNSDYPHPVSR